MTRTALQLVLGLVALDINPPITALGETCLAQADTTPRATPPTPTPPPTPPATPPATPDKSQGLRLSISSGNDDAPGKNRAAFLGLTPEMVQKLSPEQLETILTPSSDPPAVAILVPGFFFASILGVVLAILFFRFRADRQRHETLRLMIERGATLAPELLTPPQKQRSDLRRGILWLAVGIGFTLLLATQEPDSWAVGMVPTLLGAGYLLAWKLEKKQA